MSETRHIFGDIGLFSREMRLFCGDLWFAEIWDVLHYLLFFLLVHYMAF